MNTVVDEAGLKLYLYYLLFFSPQDADLTVVEEAGLTLYLYYLLFFSTQDADLLNSFG